MPLDGEYHRLLLRIAEGAERPKCHRLSWRESLGTLMLGALATSLGVAVLAWLVTRDWSFDTLLTAWVGHLLGLAGVVRSRREGRGLAPLSALGFALCLIPLLPFYLLSTLSLMLLVAVIGLPIYAVRVLVRGIERADHASDQRQCEYRPEAVSRVLRAAVGGGARPSRSESD
jgi:hypothetical protein